MLSRLAVLSRYTGAQFARQAIQARTPGALAVPVFASASSVLQNSSRNFSWTQLKQGWNAEKRQNSGQYGRQSPRSYDNARTRAPAAEDRVPNSPTSRVYVGNLTDDNRHEIIAFINTLPNLVTANSEFLNDGRRRNFIHMTFKTVEDATHAKEQIQERFQHANLRLDYATQLQTPVLFIGGVSPTIRPQVLQFAREIPGFERFFDFPARDGSFKEFLHVSFVDVEAAQNAHGALTKAFDDQGVRVDYALNKAKDSKEEPRVEEDIPPSSDLFIGNLSFHASEADILSAFDGVPGFVEMHISRDFNGRNRGFARATFDSIPSATEAIALINGKEVLERPMTATFSKLRPTRPASLPTASLFVGGLPHDVTENVLRAAIAGFEGLKGVKLMSNPLSGKPAWAIAEYETVEQAEAVVEACHFKQLFPNGPRVRIDYHHSRKQESAESNNPPSTTLFVGGIKNRTVKDLYDIFREHSPRDARVIISDETGNPRGFGYVTFNDIQAATDAMKALDGKSIGDDTSLRVNFAASPKERRAGYVARGGSDRRASSGGGGGGSWGARGWSGGDSSDRSSYGTPRRSDRGGKLPYQTKEYKQERRERKERSDY